MMSIPLLMLMTTIIKLDVAFKFRFRSFDSTCRAFNEIFIGVLRASAE